MDYISNVFRGVLSWIPGTSETEQQRLDQFVRQMPTLDPQAAPKIDFVATRAPDTTRASFKRVASEALIARDALRQGGGVPLSLSSTRQELQSRIMAECDLRMGIFHRFEKVLDELELTPLSEELAGVYLQRGDKETRPWEGSYFTRDKERTKSFIPKEYDSDNVVMPNLLFSVEPKTSAAEKALFFDLGYAKNAERRYWNKFECSVDNETKRAEILLGVADPAGSMLEKRVDLDLSFVNDDELEDALKLIGGFIMGKSADEVDGFTPEETARLQGMAQEIQKASLKLIVGLESGNLTGLEVEDCSFHLRQLSNERFTETLELFEKEFPALKERRPILESPAEKQAFEKALLQIVERKKALEVLKTLNYSTADLPELSFEIPEGNPELRTLLEEMGRFEEEGRPPSPFKVVSETHHAHGIDLSIVERGHTFNKIDRVIDGVSLTEQLMLDFHRSNWSLDGVPFTGSVEELIIELKKRGLNSDQIGNLLRFCDQGYGGGEPYAKLYDEYIT
ncbi:MAG: hypothetical protein KDK48_02335, partial [Chlamydiia bacterium]|nr:hypothetical protein [Chlamydiia bacterium]